MSLQRLFERWLGWCAARTIRHEQPFIIAITGTIGKSSTKSAVGIVLDAENPTQRIRVAKKNYNNELGAPLTVFGKDAPGRSPIAWLGLLLAATLCAIGWRRTEIDVFVFEMGADKPGDLANLVTIAPPNISIVTAVTPEGADLAPVHVANYPSIEAVAEEKSTLIRALPMDGTAILNADDPRARAMRSLTSARVFTFGETDGADVQMRQTRVVTEQGPHGRIPKGLEMHIVSFNRLRKIFLPGVFSRSSGYAMAAAFLLAAVMDTAMEAEDIIQRIELHYEGLPGRAKIIPGIKYTTLLDGTYNSSPAAVLCALRDLKAMELEPHQRRIACLGEMRELGEMSASLHARVGAEAAKLGLDLLVACGTLAHAMAEGAMAHGMAEENIKIFQDTPEAGRFLQDWIKPGDVILAKASEGTIDAKGVRMERIIKELMAEPQRASELLVRQEAAWNRK